MSKIIIQEETTRNPLQLIGKEAGICWGADVSDSTKNIERAIDCIKSEHGRTWEFPQVYMILDDYSARVIREFYTHIGGASTRLQASTRYINYEKGFDYIIPPSIKSNSAAEEIYKATMDFILTGLQTLKDMGIPREDCGMLLPLGMTTKVVCRINFRTLVDMSHQRMCTRAYWEFRQLFTDIYNALSEYSDEWKYLANTCFKPKCEVTGFCKEKKTCGRKPVYQEQILDYINEVELLERTPNA